MNLRILSSIAAVLFLVLTSCNTVSKTNEISAREPQSSVYSEIELFATDGDTQDGLLIGNEDNTPTALEVFGKFCKEPKAQALKKNDRVVTVVDGKTVAGNIVESYNNGTEVEVALDYGPTSTLQQSQTVKRSSDQVSKALICVGTKSKKIYGLFQVDNKFYTGHVREVFVDGTVRYVNDAFHEQFTTASLVTLETLNSNLKLKPVLFAQKGTPKKGEIKRVFGKDTIVIRSGGELFLRKTTEVEIAD